MSINEYLNKCIDEMKDEHEKIIKNKKLEDESESEKGESNGDILFSQITESSISILQNPEIEKALVTIGVNMNMDEESIASLMNIMAIAVTHSSYNAILFYDDLLKKELTKQMENTAHHINLCKTDIEAYKSIIQIHQKQIGELKNALKINDIKKENQ